MVIVTDFFLDLGQMRKSKIFITLVTYHDLQGLYGLVYKTLYVLFLIFLN